MWIVKYDSRYQVMLPWINYDPKDELIDIAEENIAKEKAEDEAEKKARAKLKKEKSLTKEEQQILEEQRNKAKEFHSWNYEWIQLSQDESKDKDKVIVKDEALLIPWVNTTEDYQYINKEAYNKEQEQKNIQVKNKTQTAWKKESNIIDKLNSHFKNIWLAEIKKINDKKTNIQSIAYWDEWLELYYWDWKIQKFNNPEYIYNILNSWMFKENDKVKKEIFDKNFSNLPWYRAYDTYTKNDNNKTIKLLKWNNILDSNNNKLILR